MPEGPECLRAADGLDAVLAGCQLTALITHPSGRYRSVPPKQSDSVRWPLYVDTVSCKGKLLIFDLTDATGMPLYAFSTLGMAGQWLTERPSAHLAFELTYLTKEGQAASIYYADQRHFGTFAFETDERAAAKRFNSIATGFYGRYVMEPQEFQQRLRRWGHDYLLKRLMDQKSLASQVGNYLVAEIFYALHLHPEVKCGQLSSEQATWLYEKAAALIRQAYESGTTRRPLEQPAKHKVCGSDALQLQVYKQDRDPLGHLVRHEDGVHKRTIHWVPELQTFGAPQ
jgi:formamidopyrimidine-DNA glycosylase